MKMMKRIGAVLAIGGLGSAILALIVLFNAPHLPDILSHSLGHLLLSGPVAGLVGIGMWQSDRASLGLWELPRHRDDRKMDNWGR